MNPETEESRLWIAAYCASVQGQRMSAERSTRDTDQISGVAGDDADAALESYRKKTRNPEDHS